MTEEILGIFDQQLQRVQEVRKSLDKEQAEIEGKKLLCKIIKSDVIDELEKEFNFKGFKKFETEFNEFLDLLEDHFKTNTDESKKSVIEKIPFIRNMKKW